MRCKATTRDGTQCSRTAVDEQLGLCEQHKDQLERLHLSDSALNNPHSSDPSNKEHKHFNYLEGLFIGALNIFARYFRSILFVTWNVFRESSEQIQTDLSKSDSKLLNPVTFVFLSAITLSISLRCLCEFFGGNKAVELMNEFRDITLTNIIWTSIPIVLLALCFSWLIGLLISINLSTSSFRRLALYCISFPLIGLSILYWIQELSTLRDQVWRDPSGGTVFFENDHAEFNEVPFQSNGIIGWLFPRIEDDVLTTIQTLLLGYVFAMGYIAICRLIYVFHSNISRISYVRECTKVLICYAIVVFLMMGYLFVYTEHIMEKSLTGIVTDVRYDEQAVGLDQQFPPGFRKDHRNFKVIAIHVIVKNQTKNRVYINRKESHLMSLRMMGNRQTSPFIAYIPNAECLDCSPHVYVPPEIPIEPNGYTALMLIALVNPDIVKQPFPNDFGGAIDRLPLQIEIGLRLFSRKYPNNENCHQCPGEPIIYWLRPMDAVLSIDAKKRFDGKERYDANDHNGAKKHGTSICAPEGASSAIDATNTHQENSPQSESGPSEPSLTPPGPQRVVL